MKDLLPYVERELSLLGAYFRRFGEKYPAIAGDLKLNSDSGGDPAVRLLTQGAAVLNARIAKKLDDDFPELTSSILGMTTPHALLPVPACTIAHFDARGGKGQSAEAATTIARGTMLKTPERKLDGLICKFRTVYPVALAPVWIAAAQFIPAIRAPSGSQLPPGVASDIAITIEWTPDASKPAGLPLASLRLFADGEPSFCAALLDTLFLRAANAHVAAGDARWHKLDKFPLAPVGLDTGEALLPFPAQSQAAFRLLTEYFSFPAKFNFFDIDLAALARHLPPACCKATLHFPLVGLDQDSHVARLLKPLSAQHLLPGCTPVVNLFKQAASPIRLNHTAAHYTLIADSLRPSAYDIYSVDAVRMLPDTAAGAELVEFRPYYSLRHGEDAAGKGHYWIMRRDAALAATRPGYENRLSFVDIDFNPLTSLSATASIELTCSNGDLPNGCDYGAPGGDLAVEASVGSHVIRMLRRPSAAQAAPAGRNLQWKLAAHLALNIASLCQDGLPAFREMLALHDRPRSATSRRQIDGIVSLDTGPTRAWLRDKYGGTTVNGVEVRVTIEEAAFVGGGIHVFSRVIDRFLGMYVHLNSFTQLTIVSHETGKELLKCPPRNGELNLV